MNTIQYLRTHSNALCRYDRKELTFRKLTDLQFCAAMAPPGGGRNTVTNRYLRHYSTVRSRLKPVRAACLQHLVPCPGC